jgi:hypothetical protein
MTRRAELLDVRARWVESRVQRRIERSSLRVTDVDMDAWEDDARREWARLHPALEAWLAGDEDADLTGPGERTRWGRG